eukprot:430520_1
MAALSNAKQKAIQIKICVLGDTVGKSCLTRRFVNGSFDGQPIEHNKMEKIYYKQLRIQTTTMNEKFEIEITDTTNNYLDSNTNTIQIKLKDIAERSMHIRKQWIAQHNVLFLLFNRLNRVSWRFIQNIHTLCIKHLSKNKLNIPIYIVSTCSDMYRSCNLQSIDMVTLKEVETYVSTSTNTFHFETSSKLNQNIDILFESALTTWLELHPHLRSKPHIKKKRKTKHKKSQSLQVKGSVLRWFKAKTLSNARLADLEEKEISADDLPLPKIQAPQWTRSAPDIDPQMIAKRQEKKEFKHLNKMYQNNTSINVQMRDVQSSDDGNDIVLIDREERMLGVATKQYDEECKSELNMNDRAMLPSNIMIKEKKKKKTIYSGYLWKCGKIVKNWKLRYFIFCDDYQLKYYTSSDLETYKGSADLTPSNVVSVDIDRSLTIDLVNGYPFVILCKNRTWKFRARTARERQQWVQMIAQVVIEAKRCKSPRTLADAAADEDAMDIFGSSSDQYLYTLNIYQAKNIARCADLNAPNVYILMEFNQCKSGNRYQTSIVHRSIDPVFNSSITELANKSEMESIRLTVYHRNGSDSDEAIGHVVIDIATFDAWYRWIWLPIELEGMIQLKLEYVLLDDALMAHQNKESSSYSHCIALHMDEYVQNTIHNDTLSTAAFMCPLVQIQWKYNQMFETEFKQSHYLYAQLRSDEKQSDLVFHVMDNQIETADDIIGEGTIVWNQLIEIEKNEMRTLKIPIFARRLVDCSLLSRTPMGYIWLRVEILSKKRILSEFYHKFVTLLWFRSKDQCMCVEEMYCALLSIGIHLSDKEYDEWKQTLATNDIEMGDVIDLLLLNKYERSVSLTHYITSYLNKQLDMLDNGWWIRFDRGPLFSGDKDDLFVMDRLTQCREREHVPGYLKIALKLMYDGWMGRIATNNIVKHLNIFSANKCSKFDDRASSQMIDPFIAMHHIDMTRYDTTHNFDTFNQFFARDIRSQISSDKNNKFMMMSPCDGKMICFSTFSDCTTFWVKGSRFNVRCLLGDKMYGILLFNAYDKFEFDEFRLENLNKIDDQKSKKQRLKRVSSLFAIALFRLSPDDYHGYHYPFDARVIHIQEIEGALYSVSPIVVNRDVNVLTENKRCCVLFQNEQSFGYAVVIVIASFLVGSFSINCKVGQHVKAGQLMGKFKFGGSAVILLCDKNAITFDQDLINNSLLRTRVETKIKLYEQIATINQ